MVQVGERVVFEVVVVVVVVMVVFGIEGAESDLDFNYISY